MPLEESTDQEHLVSVDSGKNSNADPELNTWHENRTSLSSTNNEQDSLADPVNPGKDSWNVLASQASLESSSSVARPHQNTESTKPYLVITPQGEIVEQEYAPIKKNIHVKENILFAPIKKSIKEPSESQEVSQETQILAEEISQESLASQDCAEKDNLKEDKKSLAEKPTMPLPDNDEETKQTYQGSVITGDESL